MKEKLIEVKELIDCCRYAEADSKLNAVYETYTTGEVYFTEDEKRLMFALLYRLSRKLYG